MRRLLTWLLVTLGVAALVRRLRRRAAQPAPVPPTPGPHDPADELRRKLAETRVAEEPSNATADDVPAGVDERRADVHAEGRAALDEMRSTGDDA